MRRHAVRKDHTRESVAEKVGEGKDKMNCCKQDETFFCYKLSKQLTLVGVWICIVSVSTVLFSFRLYTLHKTVPAVVHCGLVFLIEQLSSSTKNPGEKENKKCSIKEKHRKLHDREAIGPRLQLFRLHACSSFNSRGWIESHAP